LNPRLLALCALAVFAIATGTTSLAQTTPGSAPPTPPPPATPNNAATQAPIVTVPGTTPTPTATDLTPPTPVPTPTPSIPSGGRHGRGGGKPKATPSPDASDTPEPAQFSNLDGVWEIEGQPFGQRQAVYSHLNLIQKDQALSGTWKRDDKHTIPVTGTFDGRVFHLTASEPGTNVVYTLTGYVENFSDMVGQVSADSATIKPLNFTGQHRKKSKPAEK